MQTIESRRIETQKRITLIKEKLAEAEIICAGKACVYATGSYARGEASQHSDLDLFIVAKSTSSDPSANSGSQLSNLDSVLLRAELIETTRKLGIPDFSNDGVYLEHYTVPELIKNLGKPEDDANNTFTARLLLLLESHPLTEAGVYDLMISDVIARYWADYERHSRDFVPAFLTNDILRLWRTFCVNYEANSKQEPEEERAKKKLKNYKLKHSRLLTCYSAVLFLLVVFIQDHTVTPNDAKKMVEMSPTARLEWLLSQKAAEEAYGEIQELLKAYDRFLVKTEQDKGVLLAEFQDPHKVKIFSEEENQFGDKLFSVLNAIGGTNKFYRLLVI